MLIKCSKCGTVANEMDISWWDYSNFTIVKLMQCPKCKKIELIKSGDNINPNDDNRFYVYK